MHLEVYFVIIIYSYYSAQTFQTLNYNFKQGETTYKRIYMYNSSTIYEGFYIIGQNV